MRLLTIVGLSMMCLLAACGGGGTNTGDADSAGAIGVVERYLQAKITADEAGLRAVMCSELEATIENEALSFSGVTDPRIENMACTFNAADNTVACTGQIVATYGTEVQTFPLQTYSVAQEDGEWKWCGYPAVG